MLISLISRYRVSVIACFITLQK